MQETLEFVYQLLFERVCRIVPNKELRYLPNSANDSTSWTAIADMVYAIERFHSSRIVPLSYKLIESTYYEEKGLKDHEAKKLKKLKAMLLNGDKNINHPSYNYLPPSTKTYFKDFFGVNSHGRYNADFNNQFFGIRHFHLGNRNEDTLLFYATLKNRIYLLKIGRHVDLYKQDIVENLVNEFPQIIHKLGICAMPDMPVAQHSYSAKQVENNWRLGQNVSYVINNRYYTSNNIQTLSNITSNTFRLTQEILYQIQWGLNQIIDEIKQKHTDDNKDFELLPYGFDKQKNIIEIGCPAIMERFYITINYLKLIKITDEALA